jgi:hypothetical protein
MMDETIEDLAKRLADVERKVATLLCEPARKDWRNAVGLFEGSEFMAKLDADVLAAREAEREAARKGIFE